VLEGGRSRKWGTLDHGVGPGWLLTMGSQLRRANNTM